MEYGFEFRAHQNCYRREMSHLSHPQRSLSAWKDLAGELYDCYRLAVIPRGKDADAKANRLTNLTFSGAIADVRLLESPSEIKRYPIGCQAVSVANTLKTQRKFGTSSVCNADYDRQAVELDAGSGWRPIAYGVIRKYATVAYRIARNRIKSIERCTGTRLAEQK